MNTFLNGTIYNADLYLRLSREDGDVADAGNKEESNSIVNQKELIKEHLKKMPEIHIHEVRIDDGYTGIDFERPAFQEMMEDIKKGVVNCVIVKDLSRFGRNYIEVGKYIEKIFPYLGVRFIAINDNVDTAKERTQSDEMMIPFKNLINDAYCRDISVKVRSQLEVKRKKGDYIGSFAPYGYLKSADDKNRLIIDELAAPVVQSIFKWKLEGMSSLRIAKKLNELGTNSPMEHKRFLGEKYKNSFKKNVTAKWNATSVSRVLKSEIYTGVLEQGKTSSPNYKVKDRVQKDKSMWSRVENNHESIIEKEMFEKVQSLLKQDTRVSPKEDKLYLFSGMIKCARCGSNMTTKIVPSGNKEFIYYVCIKRKQKKQCENKHTISKTKLEEAVLATLNHHINEVVRVERMLSIVEKMPYQSNEIKRLQKEIEIKDSEIEKYRTYSIDMYGDYKDGLIDKEEYLDLKDWYKKRCDALMCAKEGLRQEIEYIAARREGADSWIKSITEKRGFEILTREVLLELVEEIKVYDNQRMEICLKYQQEYDRALSFITKISESVFEEEKSDIKKVI